MAAREIFELIINADGSRAQATFGNLAGNVKKEFGDLETKSGGFFDKLVSKSPTAQAALDRVGISAGQTGSVIEKAIPLAAAAGGAAIGAFAVKAVSDFQNSAQAVLHFSQVSGTSADQASRWVQVADDFGTSSDEMATSMGRLAVNLSKNPELFDRLGVSIKHTADGGVDLQGTFLGVIDAYNATTDQTKKAELGQAAFGRGWQSLVKLLDAGSQSVQDDFNSISATQIFSPGQLAQSEKFRLAMDDLHDRVQGLEFTIGGAVLPVLTKLATALNVVAQAADKVSGPLGGLNGVFALWAKTLSPALTAIDMAGTALEKVGVKAEIVEPHIANLGQLQADFAKQGAAASAAGDLYSATLQRLGVEAETAVTAHDDHRKALDALRDAYGSDTAVMISNMGLTDAQMETTAEAAKSLLGAMQSSFNGATDVVSHFAEQGQVSTDDVIGWMKQQVDQAHTWAAGLKELAADGIDHGILQKLEEAGPKSAGLISALLEAVKRGDINAINSMQADLNTTLSGAQKTAAGYEAGFASTGTALGAAMKNGVVNQTDGLSSALGAALAAAASLARANSLPAFVDAGVALGRALSNAAAQSAASARASAAAPPSAEARGAKAAGGVLSPGLPTLVGEKGVELIVPGIQPKTVIPNNVLRGALGGGVNATVNINAPVYGVDDLQGAIYGALDNVRRRAMAGAR